jgi:hypothetical protein
VESKSKSKKSIATKSIATGFSLWNQNQNQKNQLPLALGLSPNTRLKNKPSNNQK